MAQSGKSLASSKKRFLPIVKLLMSRLPPSFLCCLRFIIVVAILVNVVSKDAAHNILSGLARPAPPPELLEPFPARFTPAPDLEEWLRATFLNQDAPLYNPTHDHLNSAAIGCLWTNMESEKHGIRIVAQAEMPKPPGRKWAGARAEYQLRRWFGAVPDFLLTFDSLYAAGVSDVGFCATSEHELYHCGQKSDRDGYPMFNRMTGEPIFTLRGHDVEEFVGIMERYGIEGGAGKTAEFIRAANQRPLFTIGEIRGACGVCAGAR